MKKYFNKRISSNITINYITYNCHSKQITIDSAGLTRNRTVVGGFKVLSATATP